MPRPMPTPWLCLAALACGCGLDTDLANRRAPRGQDAPASGGPLLELVAPAPGQQDVPPNLTAVVLRSAASAGEPALDPAGARLVLRAAGSAPLALSALVPAPCAETGDDDDGDPACFEAALPAGLAARTSYALEVQAGELPARGLAQFATAAAPDTLAPEPGEVTITYAADCLRVRGAADAPVRAELVVRAAPAELRALGGVGAAAFDFPARLTGLPPGGDATAEVVLRDLAGNASTSPPVPLRVPAPAGAVAITEVLANPAGAEGTQELVELRNLGDVPAPLEGLVLEDDGGGDALPAALLGPGAYVVVLPADFVIGAGDADPPPRPGTLVVRIAGRLGKDGLGPREGVRLRGRDGAVLSSYGGWVDQGGTAWSGRSVQRWPAEGACDHPRAWTRNPRPPTPGW
jgi:hypothetical protein